MSSESAVPPRRPGSARRTSHIDMIPARDGLLLQGGARDVVTGSDGEPSPAGAAAVNASLDAGHRLGELRVEGADDPTSAALASLLGRAVGKGFRAAVLEALPEEHAGATPLHLLLDDLPVAALISGYRMLYNGNVAGDMRKAMVKSDLCAGWRSDGTMMVALRDKGVMPVPIGPPPTDLVPAGDPLAWHQMPPLGAGSMRRQRLVDLSGGAPYEVYAMFRDTFVDDEGTPSVLHQYSLTAQLDPVSLVLSGTEAKPEVLPWNECPAAAASARGLDGHAAGEVRNLVSAGFRGTSTCTHLNDLLRSLGDLARLAALVCSGSGVDHTDMPA